MVNKAEMIKKTADLVNDKKIEGIADIKDESDRNGMRIVYYLKRDSVPNVVLNTLYKYTQLQSSFSVNNIALVNGRPEQLTAKDMIYHFINHRIDVVIRRTKYDLRKAEERAHILEGLIIASDNIDEVIQIIRSSKSPEEARDRLKNRFELTEIQARAIVDMRLRSLTGLEQDKLRTEYDELLAKIVYLNRILNEDTLRMEIIKEELLEVKEKYGDERRTEINYAGGDVSIEDMIPDEEVVITISHAGYIKRTALAEYKKQGRGGIGQKGVNTRDADFVEQIFVATNHNYLLFFTEWGRCFWLRVYEVPEGSKASKGRAIQNLINIPQDDNLKAFINTKDLKNEDYVNSNFIVMVTKKGIIKKTSLEAYSRPRINGINAITVREGDTLLEAKLTTGNDDILMAVKSGKAIRFNENAVRSMGRNASGVRGVNMTAENDEVVGMVTIPADQEETSILVVSEKGFGKRTLLEDYRITNRGGKGVKTIGVSEKTGHLVSIKAVTDADDLMVINKSGIMIRIGVADLRVMGRATQGVKLINLRKNDQIASVAKVPAQEEEDEIVDLENPAIEGNSEEGNIEQKEGGTEKGSAEEGTADASPESPDAPTPSED
jgi:DNA gyrase subunit A